MAEARRQLSVGLPIRFALYSYVCTLPPRLEKLLTKGGVEVGVQEGLGRCQIGSIINEVKRPIERRSGPSK